MNDTAVQTAPVGSDLIANLTNAFAAAENPIDNSQQEPETAEAPPEEVKPEPAAEEEKAVETETPEGETAEEAESPSDDTFLTRDQIEEKYARSNTIGLRNLTADYAEKAAAATQKNDEILTTLGGEPFIEPLGKIAQGLAVAETDPQRFSQLFFEGVYDVGGEAVLQKTLAHAMHLAFVQAPAWADNPATADFGKSLNELVDVAVAERFGMPTDRLVKSADWDKMGWPDKLSSWSERFSENPESMSDIWDELEEMLTVTNDPKLKALAEENAALKRQKETGTEVKQPAVQKDETQYNEYAQSAISTVLEKVMWKDSPLTDVETDTPEMKEVKGYLRDALTTKSLQAMHADPTRGKLLTGFRDGKYQTAVYQTDFVTALDNALQKTAPDRTVAEKILASLYGKTRNAKLATTITNGQQPPPPQAPTVPTNFAPPAGQVKTKEQITKQLEQAFIDQDSRG